MGEAAVPKTVSRRGFEPHYAHYGLVYTFFTLI